MGHSAPEPSGLDSAELKRLRAELSDWSFSGKHHMHKTWQFRDCHEALHWHALAQGVNERHGRDCFFYLGNVGAGRIDTDIFNRQRGELSRSDLVMAAVMGSYRSVCCRCARRLAALLIALLAAPVFHKRLSVPDRLASVIVAGGSCRIGA